jgi:hypothetical protein
MGTPYTPCHFSTYFPHPLVLASYQWSSNVRTLVEAAPERPAAAATVPALTGPSRQQYTSFPNSPTASTGPLPSSPQRVGRQQADVVVIHVHTIMIHLRLPMVIHLLQPLHVLVVHPAHPASRRGQSLSVIRCWPATNNDPRLTERPNHARCMLSTAHASVSRHAPSFLQLCLPDNAITTSQCAVLRAPAACDGGLACIKEQ